MYRYKHLCSAISIMISSFCFSQKIISGTVVDAVSRQPLEAAYVSQQNNMPAHTLTDHSGNFTLKVNTDNAVLKISFVGYKTQNLVITGQKELNIAMQPDALSLENVVITQSTGQQRFTTIAKIDLDLKPVKSTQELMRIIPGLFIAQHAGGGKAEQIFLRGFDIDHGTDIKVTADGSPVNMVSHAHGQGYADAHFIIPETIHNIDFGTGPYYAKQGNLNTAGYINFNTYKNIPQSRVQVEVGRYNTFRALAMIDLLKKNKDKQSAYIAGEFNYTDGPTINKQNFDRLNIFGKYNRAISNNTQLTLSASAFDSKWDASGQVPTRAVESGMIDRFGSIDPSEGGNTSRYNATVMVSHQSQNGLKWDNQAFYSRYHFNLFSNFTFYLNDPINGDEIQQSESRDILGYNTQLSKKYFLNDVIFQFDYGVGLRYDATQNSELSHVVKRMFLENVQLGNIKETNAFAYTRQQVLTGKWLFEGGLRFDYLHFNYFDQLQTAQLPAQYKTIISPKINVEYTINRQVQLYLKTGKGFHSNDTRVVTASKGYEILPAAYGADLGITLKPFKNLFINAAGWYLYMQQEFIYVGDEGIIEPGRQTRREGIDLLARYQFTTKLFANININLTRPRAIGEPKGADHIPLAPIFTSTGGLFYKQKQGFNGGLSYRYIKDRPANEDNSIVAKGYLLLDGSFNYTKPGYELGIALENIFNVEWNEAQFATESRLKDEPQPVTELHYTPGALFFIRAKFMVFF